MIRDFRFGLLKAASGDQPDGFTVPADMDRLKDRLNDLEDFWTFISGKDPGDHPKTHGALTYEVVPLEVLATPENRDIQHIARYLEMMYFEIANSQSSALVTGLQKYDAERILSYIHDLRAFVTEYLEKATPNDYPDASPEENTIGPGRTPE